MRDKSEDWDTSELPEWDTSELPIWDPAELNEWQPKQRDNIENDNQNKEHKEQDSLQNSRKINTGRSEQD